MKSAGGYSSVAFSVRQADDDGAVGVGVGVAVAEADSVVEGVPNEAADWPPHAVAEMTTAKAIATPASSR